MSAERVISRWGLLLLPMVAVWTSLGAGTGLQTISRAAPSEQGSRRGEAKSEGRADESDSIPDPDAPAEAGSGAVAEVEELLSHDVDAADFDDAQVFPPGEGGVDELSPQVRRRYVDALRKLLDGRCATPETDSAAPLEAARQQFQAARKLCADDHRLPYAFGLVLSECGALTEALAQFRQAAELAQTPHLGAQCQIAFLELMTGNADGALEACQPVVKGIAGPASEWPGPEARRKLAGWMGQVIGYLEASGQESGSGVRDLRAQITADWPAELADEFRKSVDGVSRRHRELTDLAAKSGDARKEAVRKQIAAAQGERVELDAKVERLEKKLRGLTTPHREELQQIVAEMKQRQKRLRTEEGDARQLAAAVQSLSQPRLHPNNPRNQARLRANGRVTVGRQGAWRKETAAEKKDREKQLKSARARFDESVSQIRGFQQELARLRSRRKDLESEFASATREVKRELNDARLSQQEAERQVRDAQAAASHPDEVRERAGNPRTYLEIDRAELRQQVRESLEPAGG